MLLAQIQPWMLFLAGVAMLTAIMLRITYRNKKRWNYKKGKKPKALEKQPRPEERWTGTFQDAEARLSRREVEFYQQVREMSGQLDTKIRLLQQLMNQCDKKTEALQDILNELKKRKG